MFLTLLFAYAQAEDPSSPVFDSQMYHMPVDSTHTLWTTDAGFSRNGYVSGRLVFGYLDDPIVYVNGNDTTQLLDYAVSANALVGVSYERIRLGLDVPVYLVAKGALESGGGIGDIALDVKGTLLDPRTAPLGLALDARFSMPTSTTLSVLSSGAWGWELGAVVDKRVGPVLFAINLGTKGVPNVDLSNVDINDAMYWRFGAGWQIREPGGLSFDIGGQTSYGEWTNPAATPIEAILGGWGRIGSSFVIRAGVGTGLTKGIGSPKVRGILSFGYEPPIDRDQDKDGIVDRKDSCPTDPEDFDGFEDEDGCPDLDNDNDGILDVNDSCPDVPEDLDTWKDEDGCPDPMTLLRLKIIDDKTRMLLPDAKVVLTGPSSPEGVDGDFEAEVNEGTYQFAASFEGYVPSEATFDIKNGPPVEVEIGLQPFLQPGHIVLKVTDPKGKSIPATWNLDGGPGQELVDSIGKAEVKPGKHRVVVSAQGYGAVILETDVEEGKTVELTAVLQKAKVKVTQAKIEFKEKIFFETNKSVIKSESFPLLNEIAGIILERKDIALIRIEGHTDNRGTDSDNLKLSDDRAKSVREYMINKGIDASRLNAIGYGETNPVAKGNNEKAWSQNRRVEFLIEKWLEEATE